MCWPYWVLLVIKTLRKFAQSVYISRMNKSMILVSTYNQGHTTIVEWFTKVVSPSGYPFFEWDGLVYHVDRTAQTYQTDGTKYKDL